MAQLNCKLDHNDTEQSFDPLPAGEYLAIIESSSYVPNKQNTGKILKLTYKVLEGPQKGKKLFENLNLENPSQQAQQISRRTLNSIGKAIGITELQDSSQLHNLPMLLDVSVKDDATYGLQNKIKKHISVNNTPSASAPAPQQTEQPPKPVNMGADNFNAPPPTKHPWEK